MIDHQGEPVLPDPEPTAPDAARDDSPETTEPPQPGRSRQYGKQPIDERASGRRARLRHPARGAVRR